ncbi:MAG: CRISPR-associated endonuclease Cas2 [Candidatus Taylorbacteria bacterium]|nr:CRISPR-associated endonuclease Cas2 [Candidatus Taylorbacteria bacterium]
MELPKSGTRSARRLAKGNKRLPIQTIALRTLYATGALTAALVAPKMLKMFPILDGGKSRRKELYERADQALYRLRDKKLITFTKAEGRRPIVRLTAIGETEITKIILRQYKISETVVWNGKWHVVIFDIREKRRSVRNRLRTLLFGAGMVRLQDSVWVHPYPCDELVALLRANLKSGTGELLYFIAEGLESDRRLREHFNLP